MLETVCQHGPMKKECNVGKIILSMMMTLDGYISGLKGELDWVVWEDEMDRDAAKLIQSVDAMLVGYGAYRDMASYWPAALTKSGSESEGTFARLINDKPKVILSQTDEELLWKYEELLVITDLAEQVTRLRQSKGDMVLYGGAGLARSFAREGLIDEYRLLVSPVAIGRGKPLFSDLRQSIPFRNAETKVYQSGAVLLRYTAK